MSYDRFRVSTVRLGLGTVDANRVLHLAFRNDELLGCCSSTLQPPWTPRRFARRVSARWFWGISVGVWLAVWLGEGGERGMEV